MVANLARVEAFELKLSRGRKLVLKSAPGPINSSYPQIEIRHQGVHVENIWTDVEFTAFSRAQSNRIASEPSHFHELDITVFDVTASPRPQPQEMWRALDGHQHRTEYSVAARREDGLPAEDSK